MNRYPMKKILSLFLGLLTLLGSVLQGAELSPMLQAKIDQQIKLAEELAADSTIVEAVKAQNAALPADYVSMNQDTWAALLPVDPLVSNLTKNAVAKVLDAKKSPQVAEAFVSDVNGLKVGFLAKTSGWSHKGKAKHDVPMSGKSWIGPIEVDASAGVKEIQVSVPVLDGETPIGSLVIGLSIIKLAK